MSLFCAGPEPRPWTSLCGVVWSSRQEDSVFVSDAEGDAIYEFSPSTAPVRFAGTGTKQDRVSIGGRATMCTIQGGTFMCCSASAVVISETIGGRITVVTDIYPHVTKVMPKMLSLADITNTSEDEDCHITTLDAARATTEGLACFLEEIWNQNRELTGVVLHLQDGVKASWTLPLLPTLQPSHPWVLSMQTAQSKPGVRVHQLMPAVSSEMNQHCRHLLTSKALVGVTYRHT